MAKPRATVFDQSFATQERIYIILRSMHDVCMRPMTNSNIDLYQRNILRIKKEAQTKFSKKEKDTDKEFLDVINRLREKWANVLYKAIPAQNKAKSEILIVLNAYEDWLYITLDRHGMLMRDRADEADALNV